MAERGRFELPKRFWRLLDFESSSFGHSDTSPQDDGLSQISILDAHPNQALAINPADNLFHLAYSGSKYVCFFYDSTAESRAVWR